MNKQTAMIGSVLQKPTDSFKTIAKSPNAFLRASFVIVLIAGALSFVDSLIGIYSFSSAVTSFAYTILTLLLSIAFIYYVGVWLKGEGSPKSVFTTQAYSSIPMLLASIPSSIITFFSAETVIALMALNESAAPETVAALTSQLFFTFPNVLLWVVGFVLLIWAFVLTIIATKVAHKFSTARAVLVVLIASALQSILGFVLGFIAGKLF